MWLRQGEGPPWTPTDPLWSGPDGGDEPFELNTMSQRDRADIVHVSGNRRYALQSGTSYDPQPVDVRRLALTSLGGWLDVHGEWTPPISITSLIGWVYILVREPYRVGDRIRIGEALGDVIDVDYLDTTLWEVGGQHLSGFHPSGRVIKFPNANVLNQPVYNYSWPLFPYIWNEIRFQVAYNADLEFISKTMKEVAEQEVGEAMMKQVAVFREILAQTPVNHLEVQERPVVLFRVSDNTWLEAIVRYLVHPKEAGRVKSRLIVELLERLNAEPDRVLFPRDSAR